MKKILLLAAITILCSQFSVSSAQTPQFSLPIWPDHMWPSDYAKYNSDVHNCCDWLLAAAPGFNKPKREECSKFLVRWLTGTPEVKVVIAEQLVDAKQTDILLAYLSGWTRHALDHPSDNAVLCANVAVDEMLTYYESNKKYLKNSKTLDNLLKMRETGELSVYIDQCLFSQSDSQNASQAKVKTKGKSNREDKAVSKAESKSNAKAESKGKVKSKGEPKGRAKASGEPRGRAKAKGRKSS